VAEPVARTGYRRLAVVTGASSGIGAATAEALGAEGWRVVIAARRRQRLEQVAERVRAAGGEAVVEALDLADPVAVASMSGRIRVRHGVPDALVHAAGAASWARPEDTSPEEMERALDAPFRAALHLTHAFLGDLLGAGSGVIVHVSSAASMVAWPGATAHVVSHWALRGLHEALRQDLSGTRVTSCQVVLGPVDTEYYAVNERAWEHRPRLGPLVRILTPAQAASTIVATIDRPRAQVVAPRGLRVALRLHRYVPGPLRWAVRVRGAGRRATTRRPRRRGRR
jgi:uncharacterized protein